MWERGNGIWANLRLSEGLTMGNERAEAHLSGKRNIICRPYQTISGVFTARRRVGPKEGHLPKFHMLLE